MLIDFLLSATEILNYKEIEMRTESACFPHLSFGGRNSCKVMEEFSYLPMEMTYLGSGIWSYTCWIAEEFRLLHKVWLRANLWIQLEERLHVTSSTRRQAAHNPASIYTAVLPAPIQHMSVLDGGKQELDSDRYITGYCHIIQVSVSPSVELVPFYLSAFLPQS